MLQHAYLDLDERKAAPVTLEAFRDLVEWYADGDEERPGMSPPLALGWDIHAKFGAEGFAIWRDLMFAYEPPLLAANLLPGDQRTAINAEQYEAELLADWADFAREMDGWDCLIVDAMSRARHDGWEICASDETNAATEAVLDDLAKRSGAKRFAETTPEQRKIERWSRKRLLDETAYKAWIAAGEPAGKALKFARWKKRILYERRTAALDELHAMGLRIQRILVAADSTDAECEAAEVEEEDFRAAWHLQHDHLWPELLATAPSLAPGTPLMGMPLPDHPNLTAQQAVALEDFYAYLPAHTYIFTPTREMWPASSVNSRIPPVAIPMREKPIPAATWLDSHRAVEQMTWAPGKPMEIRDKLIADGGWIDRPGCTTFNLYRPPTLKPAAGDVAPWVNHVRYVFGDDADHIINWLAHRVQFPDQKVNHALVLGGPQGIGKDTMIEPIKAAVGPWNCSEVSPQQMLGRFNGFVKSVILRISEARDLGDTDRYGFYEHMKTLTASPPDVLRVDEKHMREHAVLNVCGVIITTNNKDSLHLPSDDRRHFVAWSPRKKDDFLPDYWTAVYRWFAGGGNEIVAHHLANVDLSGFDAKAPPPKTPAFWEIVDSSRAPEDAEMADAIDALGKPDAVTLGAILPKVLPDFSDWLRDRKNRRKIPHRLDECGYVPVRNPTATDGYWVVNRKRVPVYAKRELCPRDQLAAAERLTKTPTG